jgi:hypothetical protein
MALQSLDANKLIDHGSFEEILEDRRKFCSLDSLLTCTTSVGFATVAVRMPTFGIVDFYATHHHSLSLHDLDAVLVLLSVNLEVDISVFHLSYCYVVCCISIFQSWSLEAFSRN